MKIAHFSKKEITCQENIFYFLFAKICTFPRRNCLSHLLVYERPVPIIPMPFRITCILNYCRDSHCPLTHSVMKLESLPFFSIQSVTNSPMTPLSTASLLYLIGPISPDSISMKLYAKLLFVL